MTNSQLLRKCRGNLKRYIILQEMRENQEAKLLPRAINYNKDNVQHSAPAGSYLEQIAVNLNAIDKSINKQISTITDQLKRANEILAEVDGDKQIILQLYYLTLKTETIGNFRKQKQYTFDEIAAILGYSTSHVKHINYTTLAELDGIKIH